MTVYDIIKAKLDEIGADGLMPTNPRIGERDFFDPSDINLAIDCYGASSLIPAFRHADGSYHDRPEGPAHCGNCWHRPMTRCTKKKTCLNYQSWRRKEAGNA